MKIRNIMLMLCLLVIISTPINAKASELQGNTISETTREGEPQIEMLTPEEAERIHKEIFQNVDISSKSVLAMSSIGVSQGDGKIYVTYTTGSRQIADKVGVRNVTFQEKSGLFWKTLSVKSYYAENTDTYIGGFSMTNPIDGAQYRAECTHYVIVDGQETSRYNETLPHTYTP